MTIEIEIERVETRGIGALWLAIRGEALCAVSFEEKGDELSVRYGGRVRRTRSGAGEKLRAYFAGEVAALDAIEVDAEGTAFQEKVWCELRRIPAGETRSYTDVARAIGAPRAVRAVASANARNPVAVVVPCHRVIGQDGKLRGYAGGLDRKQWLIAHERDSLSCSMDPARKLATYAANRQPERTTPPSLVW